MKISLSIVLCLALAMTSAFRIRQGNGMGQLMTDMQQGIQDGNQALTDTEGLLNDATEATEGMANQFIGQGLNAAGQLTGAAVGGTRLQQGNLAQDIGTLNQATLGAIQDGETAFNDALDQTELLTNNALQGFENAMGAQGATVNAPTRLQQATQTDVADDTNAVTNDFAGLANDGIQITNDMIQQTNEAFNQIFGGMTGGMAGRRLQRAN